MNDIQAALCAFNNSLQGSWDWDADATFASCADNVDPELLKVMLEVAHGVSFGMGRVRTHDAYLKNSITKRRLAALRSLIKSGDVTADWAGTGPGGASELGVRRVRMYTLKTSFYKVTRINLAPNKPPILKPIFASQSAMNAHSPHLWGTEDFGDKIVISLENASHHHQDSYKVVVTEETPENFGTIVQPDRFAFSHSIGTTTGPLMLKTFYFVKEA